MFNKERLRAILTTEPVWAVYPLADLQPAFAPYCRWGVAEHNEGEGVAMLFTALTPPILFLMGPNQALTAALGQIELPDELYLTVREQHLSLLAPHYDFGDRLHPMWRMVLTSPAASSPALPGLRRLHAADSKAIRRLLDHGGAFTPDAFEPYQLDDGVFFGIKDEDGALLAVGGTHIIDRDNHAAAIGNMYTHPAHRGQGYAGVVLGAIVQTLRSQALETIVLNVDQANPAARRLYEKHGFQVSFSYIEGICIRV